MSEYHLYACLPFVEIAHESSIRLGPLTFWPASRYQEFIKEKHHSAFKTYIETISQLKAKSSTSPHLVNTIKLAPEVTTCISISSTIPDSKKEAVLIDSLYILYFACTFRDLYYGNEIPSFNAFRKIAPCSLPFIEKEQQWKDLFIPESNREETVCIHLFDKEICKALGKALTAIYTENQQNPQIEAYTRLARSIRYLVDRFFHRFVNLFDKGMNFSNDLFEPEDVIFLASSFEALFDIDDKHMAADFKHKLRPLLHLKFAKPLEIFWKWVDDFYDSRRNILHGAPLPDPQFKLNPNFDISHLLIGIKLFIYSVYYNLHLYGLIKSTHEDAFSPPDFKWIHPEEVLLFFWTEESLLKKIIICLDESRANNKENLADLHALMNLFSSMMERYFLRPEQDGILFIPTPLPVIKSLGEKILGKSKRGMTDRFIRSLQKRMEKL